MVILYFLSFVLPRKIFFPSNKSEQFSITLHKLHNFYFSFSNVGSERVKHYYYFFYNYLTIISFLCSLCLNNLTRIIFPQIVKNVDGLFSLFCSGQENINFSFKQIETVHNNSLFNCFDTNLTDICNKFPDISITINSCNIYLPLITR